METFICLKKITNEIAQFYSGIPLSLSYRPETCVRPPLVPHQLVYTQIASSCTEWVIAEVESVIPQGSRAVDLCWPDEGHYYNLVIRKNELFENKRKRKVTGKYLAYHDPPAYCLPVGTRVIASNDRLYYFYAGVVIEQPRDVNNHRYLVLLDNGQAQYVRDVRIVCFASQKVWDDVETRHRSEIQEILSAPRQLVRLSVGKVVRIAFGQMWKNTKVIAVDCSLVQLLYRDNPSCTEWIYRGSPRLAPLHYDVIVHGPLPSKLLRGRGFGTATTHRMPGIKESVEECEAQEEYEGSVSDQAEGGVLPDDQQDTNSSEFFNGLRRCCDPEPCVHHSSSIKDHLDSSEVSVKDETATVGLPVDYNKNDLLAFHQSRRSLLPEGTIVQIDLPDLPQPRGFTLHQCGESCMWVKCSISDVKLKPSLIRPLFFGFKRVMVNNTVKYYGPCGKKLSFLKELQAYLNQTNSCLTIDLFTFRTKINIFNRFVEGSTFFHLPDYYMGFEVTPLTCVNEMNNTPPPPLEVVRDYCPSSDVFVNRDPEFLIGCDCVDDCQDTSRCSCHQMTLEGKQFCSQRNPGYKYRRLLDRVTPVIYECNSRCKCSARCLNRVVQQPVSVNLQLFQTEKKGWGVRTLEDIPHGTYVTKYTGQLLTDNKAEEVGLMYGDKFLAELDLIEVAEREKEGYEPFVIDPEASAEESQDVTDELQTKPTTSRSVRKMYDAKESVYIVDANKCGNVSRYFNHSCSPNMFIQNVFVDTYDLRFPLLAFFTAKNIPAGTELTWDYNYDVGTSPHKTIMCYCGASNCRKRLL